MQYKIGCSIRFSTFTSEPKQGAINLYNAFGGKEKLLEFLGKNVDAVELRMVDSSTSPLDLLNAVELIKSYGITATIHGTLAPVEAFFLPYKKLFSSNVQNFYNIIVHPTQDRIETVKNLKDICQEIEKNNYPVRITLENQRKKTEDYFGTCADVTDIVTEISSPHLFTCFDFGHQISNERKYDTDFLQDDFLRLVKHTHIHSIYEGRTHFPLNHGETLLERNITCLIEKGFDGVFSLELSSERYENDFNVKDALVSSINILKTAVSQVILKNKMINFYKNDYLTQLEKLKLDFEKSKNCVALIGHSCYLIKFENTLLAVDLSPTVLPLGDKEKTFVLEWLKDFDGYITTHAHIDHYDPNFYPLIPKNLIKYLPDFIDSHEENPVKTFDGARFLVKDIELCFFESGHTGAGKMVREYGFYIEYNGEKYLFPCDVRNYDFAYPKFDNVRALFCHLWFGRGQALINTPNEYALKFCDFVKQFNAKENFVAHLYDLHRPIEEMWSELHVDIIKPLLPNVKEFLVGDLIEF